MPFLIASSIVAPTCMSSIKILQCVRRIAVHQLCKKNLPRTDFFFDYFAPSGSGAEPQNVVHRQQVGSVWSKIHLGSTDSRRKACEGGEATFIWPWLQR